MNVEPIIKVRFNRFKDQYDLSALKDGVAFERFVNHSILSSHQPDAFGSDSELLDTVCVGGFDDMGMDGLGIKINGFLINNIDEAKDIIDKFQRVSVEFIFVQSKMSSEFNSGEFIKFTSGVRDFLSENHLQPMNESVTSFLKIKDYLLSDDVVFMWEKNPSVRAYYVAMGKWQNSPHIKSYAEQFKQDVDRLSAYGECNVHFVDANALKTICDNNENTFNATIETIDSMPLTDVDGVDNSCVILCYASEFMKLLSTEEGVIRKSLFEDNVRDYQGANNVNDEISKTIDGEPEKFALLNNGITIVCDEYIQSNRRITLKNPQIVNGCQTSHVIFFSSKEGRNIEKAPLHIKIISTNNIDITNQIVRGTNRQNIVYDEAFEATKIFHKELEDFFVAINHDYGKVYYERRSKQYQHNPKIKPTQKVNLKTLTQYSIAVLLNKPHKSHRHEAKLIEEFSDKIFVKHQSKLPYYAVALLFVNTEKLLRTNEFSEHKIRSYRPHVLMVLKEIYSGVMPKLHKENQVDNYFKNFLSCICDKDSLKENLHKAIEVFEKASDYWIKELDRSSDGRKDIEDFTNVLLEFCKDYRIQPESEIDSSDETDTSYSEVVKIITDRNGYKCGFINKQSGDIFFHSESNPDLDFTDLVGKMVTYDIESSPKNNKPHAVNVRIVASA